ncbi:hypothetical protein M011DRAFT_403147 [Sporormia fimetaria CBS 119925]|uniref:Rhodopsin domain-containing protein n=1 Tax=Sporormia fimetaria CBS 119925 TaxID=1340428 RepID=A0A6A6VD38_9PLEO|nr:hypothetical protein M011DRAFT_403147 [Sporormia fimetaria CBS 119925]
MTLIEIGGVVVDTEKFGFELDTNAVDFTDRSSNEDEVWTSNVTLISLVTIFVGLRIFARTYMMRKLFLDDVLILVASAFTIALASVCLHATKDAGLGTHVWMLPFVTAFDTVKHCIQYLFVCQVLYACAIAFTKLSIIASYLRFFQEPVFRIAMHVTALLVLGIWVTGIFVTIFQCQPVAAAWDFTIRDSRCISFVDYLYASSAISVTLDVVLCVLPWPFLWRLNMPTKQKVLLCLLLGAGAGACVAGVMRISQLYTLRSIDVTFRSVTCLNLSVIECSLGIICVSIPPIRPLFIRVFPRACCKDDTSVQTPLHKIPRLRRATISGDHAERQADAMEAKASGEMYLGDDSSLECQSPSRPEHYAGEVRYDHSSEYKT